jgi:hypothetical protein
MRFLGIELAENLASNAGGASAATKKPIIFTIRRLGLSLFIEFLPTREDTCEKRREDACGQIVTLRSS